MKNKTLNKNLHSSKKLKERRMNNVYNNRNNNFNSILIYLW